MRTTTYTISKAGEVIWSAVVKADSPLAPAEILSTHYARSAPVTALPGGWCPATYSTWLRGKVAELGDEFTMDETGEGLYRGE